MEKQCTKCGIIKPASQLKADKRYASGFSSYCKDCHKAASIAWQKANPEKVNATRRLRYNKNKASINEARKSRYSAEKARVINLPYRYGMTVEDFEKTLLDQGGCAICGRPQAEFKRRFAVDHDHKCCPGARTCGKCVRGILCHHCNVSLNALEATDGWAHKAEAYLRRNRK